MGQVITGTMDASGKGDPDYKGRIGIHWGGSEWEPGRNTILPGCLTTVRDNDTGAVLPVAGFTVRVPRTGLIIADAAVYLDERGEIMYDVGRIRETEAVPATFPFLVAGMRVR